MDSVESAWRYQAMLIAGYGFVTVARWFWWRINAWAELSSLAGSAIGAMLAYHVIDFPTYGQKFIFTASISIVSWIVVALLTRPDDIEKLAAFCRAVKPYPALWGPVQQRYDDIEWSPNFGRNISLWLLGTAGILCFCFGLGHLLLGTSAIGLGMLAFFGFVLVVVLLRWRP